MSPENVDRVIRATCCLHNPIQEQHDDYRTLGNSFGSQIETDNIGAFGGLSNVGYKSPTGAVAIMDYFSSPEGNAEWQLKVVRRGCQNMN